MKMKKNWPDNFACPASVFFCGESKTFLMTASKLPLLETKRFAVAS